MTLLLSVRLHKTKAVMNSERPWWTDTLDEEMKRRMEINDRKRKEEHK